MPGKIMVVRHEAHTGLSATFTAATDLGAAVKVTGAKSVGPAGVGDTIVGVSHHEVTAENVTDGENKRTFRLKGDVIPMIASGAITAGSIVVSAANGRVAARSTATPETAEKFVGVAWTAAGAAGEEVLVIVQ
jgi:hypothetical protein